MNKEIIEEFEKYCQKEVLPALREDAEEGWWKGISETSFKTERGDDYYTVYVDYPLAELFNVTLSLWGVLEKEKTLVINCKATFSSEKVGNDHIKVLIDGFCKFISEWGFGVSSHGASMCVWASLDEEEGQYNVEYVKNPYELYAFFLDNMVELMGQIGDSLNDYD